MTALPAGHEPDLPGTSTATTFTEAPAERQVTGVGE
jgi:hypothetical protein